MADYKLITMAAIMLSINVVLWLAQSAIAEIGNNELTLLEDGSPLDAYTTTYNGTTLLNADKQDFDLPVAESVDEGSGNIFTDTFKSIKTFIEKQDSKFGLVTGVFTQPYGFMIDSGIPQPIATGFGVIWYVMLTLLVVGFIRGGNQ
jgi:hypothetical protein